MISVPYLAISHPTSIERRQGAPHLSGEYTVATKVIDDAMAQAEANNAMDPDAMALALLSTAVRTLSGYRSRADIEMAIEYDLDHVVEQDQVITRGC